MEQKNKAQSIKKFYCHRTLKFCTPKSLNVLKEGNSSKTDTSVAEASWKEFK
jgi:hypothetical protein